MRSSLFFTGGMLLVLMCSCTSGNADEQVSDQEVISGMDASVPEAGPVSSGETADNEPVFLRYDAVKKALHEWNEAITRHRTIDMENLYADTVIYYSEKLAKQSVFSRKNEWFKKHPFHSQELGPYEIYYDDSDSLGLEFTAAFTKVSIEKEQRVEVDAYLYFRKFGEQWKIVKETDAITEVYVAKKKPVTSLPLGNYSFYQGYWSDTRDIPQLAHDMVPYNTSLDLKVTPKGITGLYNEYSGTTRSRIFYLVKSGKIVNGILELQLVYSESDETSLEDLEGNEETETWRFKILPDQKLLGISKENGALYAKTLRRLTD